MKLNPINPTKIRQSRHTSLELEDFILSFINTNDEYMEISNHKYVTAKSAKGTLDPVIKRLKVKVSVITQNGKVYLKNNNIKKGN